MMFEENEPIEQSNDSEVNYQLDFIAYSQNSLNYALYIKLNQFERHFDNITTKYKSIALTWMLATFAGIGFLLSKESSGLPFNHLLVVSFVAFLGILGNSLLWYLDVNIYSKFWAGVFIEEVRMEKKFNFLLQSKHIDLLIDDDRNRIFSHGLLYLTGNCLLLVAMGCFIFYYVITYHNDIITGITIGSIIILLFAICFYMINKNNKTKLIFDKLINELDHKQNH